MSILEKWGKAIESRNEDSMNDCIHDDYKFTLHSAGKILFENDEVGVEHAIVTFEEGNKQAVLAFFTFKDGKVYTHETGASNLPK